MSYLSYPDHLDSHFREKEQNYIDPDDGNSWQCGSCHMPIFSTPFIESDDGNGKVIYLHDQCANLPKELKGSVLHPTGNPLILRDNLRTSTQHYCAACKFKCGTKFYHCPDCGVDFDVSCALTIKILHRSHHHRLMVIRSAPASFFCGACGTQHHPSTAKALPLVFMCNACGFWIHPDCALLPNIIVLPNFDLIHHYHHHPLVLNYGRPDSSMQLRGQGPGPSCCAICGNIVESWGYYSCIKCPYDVHIRCAVSDPQRFKQVLIREARLPDLVHFPIPDEHTSAIRYITESTSSGESSTSSDHHDDELHEHPLILYDGRDDDNDNDDHPRLCSACVQSISPPFYRCSECPDFFLHNCCAHLPRKLTQHRALKQYPEGLSLVLKSTAICRTHCCHRLTNGFTYSVHIPNDIDLDVLCALMPTSITHVAHLKSHILYSSFTAGVQTEQQCDCCGQLLRGVFYECWTCSNFRIDARCALLPNTVRHRFDQHPLKLITTTSYKQSETQQQKLLFCEVCESSIDNRRWYHSCIECDQSFHTDCIPCLDRHSMIKFGVTSVRVRCHECPLTLIRGHAFLGTRCGYCGQTFSDYDRLMFECSKCYFRIHLDCAEKCWQQS